MAGRTIQMTSDQKGSRRFFYKRKTPTEKPEKRLCRDCASDLKEGAIKCASCGSYQNWQARIQSGQLLFGFVLLLLSLIALKPIKDLIFGTEPRIHAAILAVDGEHVVVVLSNSGNGIAVLKSVYITANKKEQGSWDSVLQLNDIHDRALKAGEMKIVSIPHNHQISRVLIPGEVANGNMNQCRLNVEYYELRGIYVISGDYFRCDVHENQ
jgi:hypothetical protein